MDNMLTIWYGISSFIFGAILFIPIRKLFMALNVNRLQAREKRAITDEERIALEKKVNVIAGIISITFAFFYNKFIMLKYF